MKARALPLSIALACAGLAQAQTTTLPTVGVVAAPIIEDNRVDAFSGFSTVVTEEQVRDANAVDLAAALRRAPGVQISRFNPVGAFGGDEGGAVFIRGMGASRPGAEIKTYIDGVPVFMGVWNHPLLDLLPLNGMQSITVFKSPQLHISGNNFASIDLATKRATAEGVHAGGRISYGSYDTLIEQLDVVGRRGNVDFMLAQSYASSDGHRANADGELSNVMGRVGLRLDEHWSLGASFLYTSNEASDPGNIALPPPPVAPTFDTRASVFSASLGHRHGDWRGDLQVYSTSADSDWLNQPGDTITRSKLSGARWREELAPWKGGTLAFGIDYDRVTGDVNFVFPGGGTLAFDGPTFRLLSPYLALSQNFPLDKDWALVPSAGVRYYDHSQFGSKTAPQAGVSLVSERLTLYANASLGINYPGLEAPLLSTLIPPLGTSWQQLGPEELNHAEIGAKFAPTPATTVDLSLFKDRVKNRYIFGFPPTVPPPPQFINLGSYSMPGAEISVTQSVGRDWSLFGGLTLLNPSIDNLPYVPDTAVTLGINGRTGPVRVSIDGQYQSEVWALSRARAAGAVNLQRVDSFAVLNARVAYALPFLGRTGEVFIAAENLLDGDYEFRPGYPMPGRSVQAGLLAGF